MTNSVPNLGSIPFRVIKAQIKILTKISFRRNLPKIRAEIWADSYGMIPSTRELASGICAFIDRKGIYFNSLQNQVSTAKRFYELTSGSLIRVNFRLIAAYSPDLYVIEYAIHLIRPKVLHQVDRKHSLTQFERLMNALCNNQKIASKQQLINIMTHIGHLLPVS